jgi:molybdopterin-containing oxidoreductase family membrane subunit
VIPAYIYNWKPIREIAIFGELLAVSAIVMCLLFVTVDIGQPSRAWELLPFIGSLNVPSSLLGWDVLVLNGYLVLNVVIVFHFLYKAFHREPYNKSFVVPLLLFSIPAAVSIHTVTAFVYNGMAARPFWNASILAPRFLASAFCSGPAILLILFQVLRRTTKIDIKDEAIQKIAELMAYAMFINLFLFGAEIFKEYYSSTHHLIHTQYLYSGAHGHTALVPYAWTSLACSVVAFVLFLLPATRRNFFTLNLGCLLIYTGVYIEKGMALVIPGMTPDTLGEFYEYVPTIIEVRIGAGIFAVGFIVFTVLCKIAIPLIQGTHPETTEPATKELRAPAV